MSLPSGFHRALGKRLQSLRGRLLAGSLALVFVLWTSDRLSQTPGPVAAKAAAPLATAHVIPDPPDRAALDTFLAGVESVSPPVELAGLRDPFARIIPVAPPTPASDGLPNERAAMNAAAQSTESPPATTPFEQSHRLQGVVLGDRPFAVIDGKSFRVGDRIDGYRILSIERERVTLQGASRFAALRIERPSLGPAGGAP